MEELTEKLNDLVSNSIKVRVLERKNSILSCKLGQSESYIQELESILEIKGPKELDSIIDFKNSLSKEKKYIENKLEDLIYQRDVLTTKVLKYEKILKDNNLL